MSHDGERVEATQVVNCLADVVLDHEVTTIAVDELHFFADAAVMLRKW